MTKREMKAFMVCIHLSCGLLKGPRPTNGVYDNQPC